MNTTTQSIADDLGLAKSTVSMALRNHPSVSPKTRHRVQETARRLNYQPNALAQAMTTGRTRVLGFAAYNFEQEHTAHIFNGALTQADALGYLIKILRVSWDMDVQAVVSQCRQHCLCGLLCAQADPEKVSQLACELKKIRIPMAKITGNLDLPDLIHVNSDDIQGIHQAIEHLARLNHQQLGFIDGNNDSSLHQNRRQGMIDAAQTFHLNLLPHHLANGHFDPLTIERQTKMMLRDNNPVTAILCINDPTAMVVIRTARAMGLQVPRDLSVIGFSDLQMAKYCDPPLTTIAQPYKAMGQCAVQHLLSHIQRSLANKTPSAAIGFQETMPTRLILRDSTGPAPKCSTS